MNRSTMHLLFTAVSAFLLAMTLWHAYWLYAGQQIMRAVSAVPKVINTTPQSAVTDSHPAVALATASALSAGKQFEAAESQFVTLIDQQKFKPQGMAARFNLANHYLREGSRKDLPGGQTRPLLEIAKQRYRDLLLINPDDWDARVNLEHALRLAPELTGTDRDKIPPIKSVDVVVPDFILKDLP